MSQLNVTVSALNIIYCTGSWAVNSGSASTSDVQATALIPFYGTRILVHGSQTPKIARGFSCSLDGLPQTEEYYDTYLCNITAPLGQYNLTITNLATNTILSLDYFLISQPSSLNPSSTASPRKTYNQPFRPFTSATVSNIGSSPTVSSAVAVDVMTASSRNQGSLIGGVVGGFALLVVVVSIVGVWFVKRRRRVNKMKAPSAMFVNSSKSLDQIPQAGKIHYMY